MPVPVKNGWGEERIQPEHGETFRIYQLVSASVLPAIPVPKTVLLQPPPSILLRADIQEADLVTATDNRGWSALSYATKSGRTAIVDAVVSLVERAVPPEEVHARAECRRNFQPLGN